MIKFPYGLSNIEQISTQGYVLVDKTRFIEELETTERQTAFLRPRRIGKSLFVSMLEYYYDINQKEKFEKIFGKYYIGQNPTPFASSYHVLKMDFSGIDTNTQDNSFNGFLGKIKTYLEYFVSVYGIFQQDEIEKMLAETSPAQVMKFFFHCYKKKNTHRIYLIIDEYDHFTNEILIRDLTEFKKSVSQDGYVRKFYEVIKEATQQGIVDRFFITGVSPITLDSLTSGFNIVKHVTHHLRFHDMMGFSEQEVVDLLLLVLKDKSRLDQIIADLRSYYNGYKFHINSPNTLYNSNMVLYFLDYFGEYQTYPRQILDPNIMPDYGKLKKMFLMANWQDNLEVLETILREGEIASEQIFQFNFERTFGRKEFVNFLYYMGNLTLKDENDFGMSVFKIPNQVIADLYWQFYADVLQERAEFSYEEDKVQNAILEMAKGEAKPFFALVQKTLEALSNRDFMKFDEKYVKLLIIAYAMQGNFFYIISERETQSGGYIDIEMYIRPNNSKKHAQFVFEVKYLKKEDESLLEKTQIEAENQLLFYLQNDDILKTKEKLLAFTVVIVKDKVFLKEVKFNI